MSALLATPVHSSSSVHSSGTTSSRLALTHNHDCTDVKYGRLHWRFTKLKAKIVLLLLSASQSPFPEVHHSDLYAVSGAFSEMRNLFRHDPAWGELIISMGLKRKGYYRLATTSELNLLHTIKFGKIGKR